MEPTEAFVQDLALIKKELQAMEGLSEKALSQAVAALKNRDEGLAHRVISDDVKINEKRFEIENRCIELMATRHPVAGDLRILVAVLNIITELERVGDYGEGIAKIVIMIGNEPPLKPLIDIPRMSAITVDMLRGAIESFVEGDDKKAAHVISMDSTVDSLYDQVFRELLTFMMADPKTITRATRLIWVAHNLERAADRATNICERVIYTVTGKMEETGASKY